MRISTHVGIPGLDTRGGGRPTLNLNFVGADLLDPQITFTRASTGTFFNSAGVLTSAAINAPRFDYNPATLAARGLLIEEQRTNLLTYSDQFDNPAWLKSAATITANATNSPDGTANADKLIATAVSANHYISSGTVTISAGASVTASVYVKAAEYNTIRIAAYNSAITSGFRVDANLSTVTGTTGTFGTGSATSSSVTNVGGGWYRVTVSGIIDASSTGIVMWVQMLAAGVSPFLGDGTSGIFVFGAQLEAGAFPTSYIPTTTTALTRSADVASVNTLSPWYNATEGTLFAQASLISSSYTSGVLVDVGAGGAFGTTEYISWVGTGWTLNPNTAPINVTSSVATSSTAKIAAAIKVNDSVISANGLIGVTDTSCGIASAPTTLSIGKAGWAAGNYLNGWIQRITYYPRRLSNAELQAITA